MLFRQISYKQLHTSLNESGLDMSSSTQKHITIELVFTKYNYQAHDLSWLYNGSHQLQE